MSLHHGDLCALRLDSNDEPLVIARYLGSEEKTEDLIFQWCGSYQEYKFTDPEERISKMQWKNGWLQPKDQRFYWKSRQDHTSHVPFTNIILDTTLTMKNILHFGFGLRPDFKIPVHEANIIIDKWRASVRDIPGTLNMIIH